MAKQHYILQPGEKLLLKATSVRHGFWSMYTDELVLTTEHLIWVKLGTFGNLKDTTYYPLSEIDQAIIGKAQNGEKQLEVYHQGQIEDFAFQSGNERTLQLWTLAIADRFDEDRASLDYNYYQSLSDESLERAFGIPSEDELDEYEEDEDDDDDDERKTGVNARFIGDVAKNVVKSGNFTVGGVIKGVGKASPKQARRSARDSVMRSLGDELGFSEVRDEFADVGNEFREAFGLKRKRTHADVRRELEQAREKQMNMAFDKRVAEAKQRPSDTANEDSQTERAEEKTTVSTPSYSMDQQIELLKNLKELLDMGILTQEEFDMKKKEIMNL